MTGRHVAIRSLVLVLTAVMLAPVLVGASGLRRTPSAEPDGHLPPAVASADRGLVGEGMPGLWSWATRAAPLGRDGAVAWGLAPVAWSAVVAACGLMLIVARDRWLRPAARFSLPTRGPPTG